MHCGGQHFVRNQVRKKQGQTTTERRNRNWTLQTGGVDDQFSTVAFLPTRIEVAEARQTATIASCVVDVFLESGVVTGVNCKHRITSMAKV
mmetsp:Transcript_9142/g.20513  ORF Transcript_9142/g.20513 Transcript_9142/m.20513 type:complete len:91 (-) Transcript_9142:1134-1406(-)